MEANKATNMLKYQEEINSRPAKSWFQTEKEKKLAKELSKSKYDELAGNTPKTKEVIYIYIYLIILFLSSLFYHIYVELIK